MPRSLTEDDVRIVKQLLAEREHHLQKAQELSYAALAEKFGVSHNAIRDIEYGRTWIHVVEGKR